MDKLIYEDIIKLCGNRNELLSRLDGKTVLITGATGLIGKTLVYALLQSGEGKPDGVKIIAPVRNTEKAEALFGGTGRDRLTIIRSDITDPLYIDENIDYIVHGASNTSSRAFIEQPADIIRTAYAGTDNMLDLARKKAVKGFVFLSTMEVYGAPQTDEKIGEDHGTDLDTMSVRSSYPESKRLCESLCAAYLSQYGVPARILRLTQTFGPGVRYDDGRVFAQFARCAIERRDIILRTAGKTRRSYLYTADAVSAILTVLLLGEDGKAYNAANEDTYCSIREMAELCAKVCAGGEINVRVEEADAAAMGYAPVLRMNLDTSRLKALGWRPGHGLEEMFSRLCASMALNRS